MWRDELALFPNAQVSSDRWGAVPAHVDGSTHEFLYVRRRLRFRFRALYNYFRDYDAHIGRYVQSDPVGLRGGMNTYVYVDALPTMYVDPQGLVKWHGLLAGVAGGRAGAAGIYHFNLISECIGGKRARASGIAVGGGIGIGLETTIALEGAGFEDPTSEPDPASLQGFFSALSGGIRLPFFNPREIATSYFEINLGSAKGKGVGQSGQALGKGFKGFSLTAFGIVGTSTVLRRVIECCTQ